MNIPFIYGHPVYNSVFLSIILFMYFFLFMFLAAKLLLDDIVPIWYLGSGAIPGKILDIGLLKISWRDILSYF